MTRSPCGVHLHPRPVERCVYCEAHLAEERAHQPARPMEARGRARSRANAQSVRANGRSTLDKINEAAIAQRMAWKRADEGGGR